MTEFLSFFINFRPIPSDKKIVKKRGVTNKVLVVEPLRSREGRGDTQTVKNSAFVNWISVGVMKQTVVNTVSLSLFIIMKNKLCKVS